MLWHFALSILATRMSKKFGQHILEKSSFPFIVFFLLVRVETRVGKVVYNLEYIGQVHQAQIDLQLNFSKIKEKFR